MHDPKTFEIEKDGRRILQITSTDIALLNTVPRDIAGADKGDTRPPGTAAKGMAASGVPANDRTAASDAVAAKAGSPWISLFDGSDVRGWSTLG